MTRVDENCEEGERRTKGINRISNNDTSARINQFPAETNQEPLWKKRLKIIIPHLCLFGLTITYSLIGAAIFSHMETDGQATAKNGVGKRHALDELHQYKEDIVNKLWSIRRSQGVGHAQKVEETEQALLNFAKNVEKVHGRRLVNGKEAGMRGHRQQMIMSQRTSDEGSQSASQGWTLGSAMFFVVTTLTTIGYGNKVPSTHSSRGLCIAYCIVGIPLYLITTANLAKFLGVAVTSLYIKYIELKHKIADFIHYVKTGEENVRPTKDDIEAMADLLYKEIENAQVVNVSAWVVYSIIISYALLGGLIFSWMESGWTLFDGFYFSFISILKVGFGEILPSGTASMAMTLFYSFFGLVITTMCVDVAGGRYLDQLHHFGRIKKPSYLECLKRSHYVQKRRSALSSLHNTVTAVRHMAVCESIESIESCAPLTPDDVRVTEITPYSMRLSWAPPDFLSSTTKYLLKYKMKLSRGENCLLIDDVAKGQCQVKNLKSFAIYEMSVRAFNSAGYSKEKRLVQITEPESAPQDLQVELLDTTSIKLTWKEPYAKKRDIEGYTVYYTTSASHSFEHWGKVLVDTTEECLVLHELEPNVRYTLCMCSRYNKGHSPISRAISIVTGDVNSNTISSISSKSICIVNDELL